MSSPRPRAGAWFGALRDRRVWALGFVVLLVVPAFLLLSRWQLHRLDERRAANAVVESRTGAAPVPVTDVLTAGGDPAAVGDEQDWREVTATGRYDPAGQLLVRKRPLDGANGFWLVTPLVLADGSVLAVNRGWVPAGQDATTSPPVPAAPSGTVTVVGRVRPSEVAPPQPADLPAGQVTDLDVRLMAGSRPVLPAYVELVSSTPAEADEPPPVVLPLPELDEGPHLSYAMQWIAFAVIAVGGFLVILRGEARRRAEDAEEQARTEAASPRG